MLRHVVGLYVINRELEMVFILTAGIPSHVSKVLHARMWASTTEHFRTYIYRHIYVDNHVTEPPGKHSTYYETKPVACYASGQQLTTVNISNSGK